MEECPKKKCPKNVSKKFPKKEFQKNVPKVIIYLKELQDLAQAILGGNSVHPDHRYLKQ
jgi:oligoribonuclease (3'-5' exoribonuclease)